MLNSKILMGILFLTVVVAGVSYAQSLESDFNNYLHYTRIARLDLAKSYAEAVIESDPEPTELLELIQENRQGYQLMQRIVQTDQEPELVDLTQKMLDIAEKGRYLRRSDPEIISQEIQRLSTTLRGRMQATERLRNSGQYAIPFMIAALSDEERKDEWPHIVAALPEIGRPAIRPLVAALRTNNINVKIETINALGKIGYPQILPHLKYIVENESSSELVRLAKEAINKIDPSAMDVPAAELFFKLAENYYYHTPSLAPSSDAEYARIWFWDTDKAALIGKEINKEYFHELMAMREAEWSLNADPSFGPAISLWLTAYFQAESTGLDMPEYLTNPARPIAVVYATMAGPEYIHKALDRAINDDNEYVALGCVLALERTAGEESLMYRVGVSQPLIKALSFEDIAVRHNASIAMAKANPREDFPEASLVIKNLVEILKESPEAAENKTQLVNYEPEKPYDLRAIESMLELAIARNQVIDVSQATDALIEVTTTKRSQMRVLAGEVLARIDSPQAQRAIADMALSTDNSTEVRIAAFNSLAVSAKRYANLLTDSQIERIYRLANDEAVGEDMRREAAIAYGSLNLPPVKVKELILEKAAFNEI